MLQTSRCCLVRLAAYWSHLGYTSELEGGQLGLEDEHLILVRLSMQTVATLSIRLDFYLHTDLPKFELGQVHLGC